jgi:SAM-dependent methyltransferase
MLGDIDFGNSVGIEIGALHAPTISREEGRVLYVDYAPTETLRASLRHPGVDPADLVDVDIIWGDRPLREVLPEPVDFAVASHVIEHVPDLIGWLLELHAALKPGGILGLAVPDRRRTFDFYRNDSVTAEMVEAHLLGYRRPSLRQIFDAGAFAKNAADAETWRPGHRGPFSPPREIMQRLPDMYRWLKQDLAVSPRYVDVHCWVFTPASFLDTAEVLARIDCFPYVVAGFYPTEPHAIEFQVRLESRPDSSSPAVAASIAEARKMLPPEGPTVAQLQNRIAALERHNQELAAALQRPAQAQAFR